MSSGNSVAIGTDSELVVFGRRTPNIEPTAERRTVNGERRTPLAVSGNNVILPQRTRSSIG